MRFQLQLCTYFHVGTKEASLKGMILSSPFTCALVNSIYGVCVYLPPIINAMFITIFHEITLRQMLHFQDPTSPQNPPKAKRGIFLERPSISGNGSVSFFIWFPFLLFEKPSELIFYHSFAIETSESLELPPHFLCVFHEKMKCK